MRLVAHPVTHENHLIFAIGSGSVSASGSLSGSLSVFHAAFFDGDSDCDPDPDPDPDEIGQRETDNGERYFRSRMDS